MHAYIVSSLDTKEFKSDLIEIHPEKTIGIKQIKDLKSQLKVRPISPSHTVVIHSADLMTIEAQNALLKTLEEPNDTQIFLVTSNSYSLLPTILSRCQLLSKPDNTIDTTNDIDLKLIKSLDSIQKLQYIENQKITKKEEALAYLNSLEHQIHSQSVYLHHKINYHAIIDTKKKLNANCNVRLAMDIFILSI